MQSTQFKGESVAINTSIKYKIKGQKNSTVGRCLPYIQLAGLNPWHTICFPEPHQKWALCSDSGRSKLSPKHSWVWPKTKQTTTKYAASNKLNFIQLGLRDRIVWKAFVLHLADPGLITDTIDGFWALPGVIPEGRARSRPWALALLGLFRPPTKSKP